MRYVLQYEFLLITVDLLINLACVIFVQFKISAASDRNRLYANARVFTQFTYFD